MNVLLVCFILFYECFVFFSDKCYCSSNIMGESDLEDNQGSKSHKKTLIFSRFLGKRHLDIVKAVKIFNLRKEIYSKCLSWWGNGWWRGIGTYSIPILCIYSIYARLAPYKGAPRSGKGKNYLSRFFFWGLIYSADKNRSRLRIGPKNG